MVNILLNGCNGYMGRNVARIAVESDNCRIAAGIDTKEADGEFPVYKDPYDVKEEVDVVIDFSRADAVDHLLEFCVSRKIPLVLCTTGLSKDQEERVSEAAKKIAVLRSANMSLGVNTMLKLVKEAAKTFLPAGFDVEIVEKHHNKKLDAPSGTALAFAEAIKEEYEEKYFVYDRSDVRKVRDKNEIGISSVRAGNIVGEHEIIFAGEDEVITFKHTATSKAVFAKGAIEAGIFLKGKPAGMYDMNDVIG